MIEVIEMRNNTAIHKSIFINTLSEAVFKFCTAISTIPTVSVSKKSPTFSLKAELTLSHLHETYTMFLQTSLSFVLALVIKYHSTLGTRSEILEEGEQVD